MDSQQVEQVFAGISVLQPSSWHPVAVRVGRAFEKLLGNAVWPLTDTSDFVLGDPRLHNDLADHSANVALDQGSVWKSCEHNTLQNTRVCKANMRLCIDGAHRGDGLAAADMALQGHHRSGCREVVYRSGKLLGELSPAFASETIAFACALHI